MTNKGFHQTTSGNTACHVAFIECNFHMAFLCLSLSLTNCLTNWLLTIYLSVCLSVSFSLTNATWTLHPTNRRALVRVDLVWCSVLQRAAVRCGVLRCVAVCYSALQCVAVACTVLHSTESIRHCTILQQCNTVQHCNTLQHTAAQSRCAVNSVLTHRKTMKEKALARVDLTSAI